MEAWSEPILLSVKPSLFIPPDTYAEEIFASIFPVESTDKDMIEEKENISSTKSTKSATFKIQTSLDKLFLSSSKKSKKSAFSTNAENTEGPAHYPVREKLVLSESKNLENLFAAIEESINAEPVQWGKESILSQDTSKTSSSKSKKKVKVLTHKRIFSNVKVKSNTNLFSKSSHSSQNSEYSTPQRLPTVYTTKGLM